MAPEFLLLQIQESLPPPLPYLIPDPTSPSPADASSAYRVQRDRGLRQLKIHNMPTQTEMSYAAIAEPENHTVPLKVRA